MEHIFHLLFRVIRSSPVRVIHGEARACHTVYLSTSFHLVIQLPPNRFNTLIKTLVGLADNRQSLITPRALNDQR
ncbi:hypothetical protein BST61_g5848 [Cercospora zeina]